MNARMKTFRIVWLIVIVIVIFYVAATVSSNMLSVQSAIQAVQVYAESCSILLGLIALTIGFIFLSGGWKEAQNEPTTETTRQPESPAQTMQLQSETVTQIACPQCGKLNYAGRATCVWCRANLHETKSETPAKIACSQCGKLNEGDRVICDYCRSNLR